MKNLKNRLDPNHHIDNVPILFYLIERDLVDYVRLLHDKCKTEDFNLPHIYAAKMKADNCLDFLLKKFDSIKVDLNGENILHTLAINGNIDKIELSKNLVNQQNSAGVTPFMHALINGQLGTGMGLATSLKWF